MEAISQWIKTISCFLIFMAIVLNILPKNNYRKYIGVFMGVLLIIVVMSPIKDIFNAGGIFNAFYDSEEVEQKKKELEYMIDNAMTNSEQYEEEYKGIVEAGLSSLLGNTEYELINADVEYDKESEDTFIKSLTITITKRGTGIDIKKVQIGKENLIKYDGELLNSIADFYNISKNSIIIYIKE